MRVTTLRTDIRIRAGVLLAIAAGLFLLVLVTPARAQGGGPDPSTPTTESSTTSSVETTTTAAPSTTRAPSTTSAPRSTTSPPRSTPSTTAPTTTESTVSTTTPSTAPPAPEIVSDDTLPSRRAGSESSGLSTDTKLALVVGALSVIGIVIAVLTYFYWRHTRPQQYMSALDALADVEQKVPRDPDDIPTAQHAVIGPAATVGGGATTAVRILEPEVAEDANDGSNSADRADVPVDDPAVLEEPTKIITVEELEAERDTGGEPSR